MRLALLGVGSLAVAALARPPVSQVSPVTVINADELKGLPTGRALTDLVTNLRCGADSIPTVRTAPLPDGISLRGGQQSMLSCVRPDDIRMVDVYRAHNLARTEVGASLLVWDPKLATGARPYALTMAKTGQFVHSPRAERMYIRENLASVPHGWSTAQMMARWTNEKRYFVPGVFPNVSSTGDWNAVAHYTQMIWPTTTRLGCAMEYGRGSDWVICRYSPPGNRDGSFVIPPPPPPLPPPPAPPPPP